MATESPLKSDFDLDFRYGSEGEQLVNELLTGVRQLRSSETANGLTLGISTLSMSVGITKHNPGSYQG